MRLLLHCCCGPCALSVVRHFRSLGCDVKGWFYNPNTHPAQEHERRAATFLEAAAADEIPLLPRGLTMSLLQFLLALARQGGRRCLACYRLRLEAAARLAAERGFDAISSTLLISPYQDIEAIGRIGEEVARSAEVEFLFADLRDAYHDGCDRARELQLYRQNYCGCIFSSLERAERRSRRAIEKALAPARV